MSATLLPFFLSLNVLTPVFFWFQYEDTFEDYLEMLIQFGYVTLFSSAFPMAAMCALVNNVIEVRSDAFKLCCTMKRPFGQAVESIGTWQVGQGWGISQHFNTESNSRIHEIWQTIVNGVICSRNVTWNHWNPLLETRKRRYLTLWWLLYHLMS